MSVREEDRKKKSSSTNGFGLAAAAIGVGVGAALYYFFSKRPEQPDSVGATSRDWNCEGDTLDNSNDLCEDSYVTISENTTTDTSIHDDSITYKRSESVDHSDYDFNYDQFDSNTGNDTNNFTVDQSLTSENLVTDSDVEINTSIPESIINISDDYSVTSITDETGLSILENSSLGVEETSDEDVFELSDSIIIETNFELDRDVNSIREDFVDNAREDDFELSESLIEAIGPFWGSFFETNNQNRSSSTLTEEEQMKIFSEQAFRERRWSLEECSICFEVMLQDQELMTLPCTHHFHVACVGPWLQEQHTCPNCRKAAE